MPKGVLSLLKMSCTKQFQLERNIMVKNIKKKLFLVFYCFWSRKLHIQPSREAFSLAIRTLLNILEHLKQSFVVQLSYPFGIWKNIREHSKQKPPREELITIKINERNPSKKTKNKKKEGKRNGHGLYINMSFAMWLYIVNIGNL